MEKFKNTFSSNRYPMSLLDACIKSFLDKIHSTKDKVDTCSKKVMYFCLTYTGHHGLPIRSQLHKILSSACPHISIRVVFRPSFRLSSFFPFKDVIPSALRSQVVYLYTCQCCGALYACLTRRHIHTCTHTCTHTYIDDVVGTVFLRNVVGTWVQYKNIPWYGNPCKTI